LSNLVRFGHTIFRLKVQNLFNSRLAEDVMAAGNPHSEAEMLE
jgi:hypothetical protein